MHHPQSAEQFTSPSNTSCAAARWPSIGFQHHGSQEEYHPAPQQVCNTQGRQEATTAGPLAIRKKGKIHRMLWIECIHTNAWERMENWMLTLVCCLSHALSSFSSPRTRKSCQLHFFWIKCADSLVSSWHVGTFNLPEHELSGLWLNTPKEGRRATEYNRPTTSLINLVTLTGDSWGMKS